MLHGNKGRIVPERLQGLPDGTIAMTVESRSGRPHPAARTPRRGDFRVTHDHAPLSPDDIERQYGLRAASVSALGVGLINQTFLVETPDGGRYVLQRLHDIFPGVVNDDIEVVTARLEERGLITPRLIRTVTGRLWVDSSDGIWRLMTYVPGTVVERVESESRAREAGALLGRFHAALADLDYSFAAARSGIHDIARHVGVLQLALATHRGHPSYQTIRPLGESILAAAADLVPLPSLPTRVVHGDPKISNFIFEPETGRGLCLVDLDTLNRMPLPLELGDALRSWCNPAGEDTGATGFAVDHFRAALSGYADAARKLITPAESGCLVGATLTIMVELAARFCADALNESYFAWNPSRFASRSEHNRVRAEGQLEAWRACRARTPELSAIVAEVFGEQDV
jgi:Ser/Thr protein kinase RdoA (MazF antagonist)